MEYKQNSDLAELGIEEKLCPEVKKEKKLKKEEKEEKEEKKEEKENEEEEEKEEVAKKKSNVAELDIELTAVAEDEEIDEKTASMLDKLYAADETEETEEEETEEVATKKGAQKLGGQPKVASASLSDDDISSIWKSAPDVSQVFE